MKLPKDSYLHPTTLGSGITDDTTFLRGDSTWVSIYDSIFNDSNMITDAFGRVRVSNPITLFDSSHRFRDNGLWNTATASGGAAVFSPNEGLVNLNVTSTGGSQVLRETAKVFSYQPGKSLLVMNTFVMAPAQVGLRQRVGYFGTENGLYVQLEDSTLSFVERSLVTGLVTETIVNQTSWNADKLDGNGPSGITLDITKAQILFMDIEWLGEGTVRLGFVIDGNFIVCHRFNPTNGWGSYDGLCNFVYKYRNACWDNPDAELRISR